MFYRDMEELNSAHFKRLTGVKREVSEQMPEGLNQGKSGLRKHPSCGTPPKLSNADKLLLLMMYYREYRTQFHIDITCGISESRVCKIIKETEGIPIKDHRFHLPDKKSLVKEATVCLADTGYQGLLKLHKNSELPEKKSKKRPLTKEDKKQNRHISSVKITIENIIRKVRIFRIIAEKYRNRRRRFALRFNLIEVIYNLNPCF